MKSIFTPELIEKAKQAKSAEEILALAKEHGMEMSEVGAKASFEKLNRSGEISDEELGSVSGGGCGSEPACPKCGRPLGFNPYNVDEWICDFCDK